MEKLDALTCKRCGATWVPRKEEPIQCPRCKSLAWDDDRDVPKKEE